MSENNLPDCAGLLLVYKARQQAHSELHNEWYNAAEGKKDLCNT
jgi:hypothetical protein